MTAPSDSTPPSSPPLPPASAPSAKSGTLADRLGLGSPAVPLITATVLGVLMGLAALGFIYPIEWMEHLLGEEVDGSVPIAGLALLLFAPAVGGLLTGFLAWGLPLRTTGHGVTQVLFGIHREGAKLPPRLGIRQWLGSTLTIGFGGSAGPEGPIVAIGSVVGSNAGRLTRSDAASMTSLLGCGAAAGLAAVFNAPIAGIFFVLEVLLRDFSLRAFTPIVVSAVVAAATVQTILGTNEPLFGVGPEFFGTSAGTFTVAQVPVFLLLGVVCGIAAVGVLRWLMLAERVFDRAFERTRMPRPLRPAVGGLLLGVLGVSFWWLLSTPTNTPGGLPPFFGTGYPAIRRMLDPTFYLEGSEATSLILGGWLILKLLATSITLGSGGSGGFFAPALVLGAAIGGLFGVVARETGWFPDASPALYALVGMAAMVAATTHAPMTAVLLVYELTRQYDFILPLMLTAAIATSLAKRLAGESLYTAELAAAGIRVGRMSDLTLLRRHTVGELPLLPPVLVTPGDDSQRLLDLAERFPVSDFAVVGDGERYLGLVAGGTLRDALVYRESIPLLQVGEIMRGDLPTLRPDDTLDRAVDRFGRADVESLPVLDEQGRVIGMLTRTRLLRHYNVQLEQD
ncbi:MAG: chloride channel protein [Phycisphaerales bacterium]